MWFNKEKKEDYSLFISDEDYIKQRKRKIIWTIIGSIFALILIIVIFTICTMFLSTDPKNGIDNSPVVNPEF